MKVMACSRSLAAGLFALWLVLGGCSATPHSDRLLAGDRGELPARRELVDVPFHPQQQYQCGPAALATLLQFSGIDTTPDALVSRVYVPGRQGSFQVEMLAATRHHQRLAHVIGPSLPALLAAVAGGRPVLVLQNLGLDWYPRWHYAVVVGYDLEQRQILLRSGVEARYVMGMKLFERTWKRADYWGMVALNPGELPVEDDARGYFLSAAAFEHNAAPALADRAWRAGLGRWPDSIELLMGHGNFLHARGDAEGAAIQFRAVTEREPEYAPAHNNLAEALLDLGRVREARQAALRAVALGGEYLPIYRQTLHRADHADMEL